MGRRRSGNRRNLPKLRLVSKRLHAPQAQPLAQTAPRVLFFNEAIADSHFEPIHQTRHLGQEWQLRVDHSSFIRDQVLCEWMFPIPHYQRPFLYALPLPLQLILCQRISLKIQHAPPRCFKAQTLVTRKVTTPLEMPQHFMVPMGEHRHVFPAQPTVKVAWNVRSI